MTSFYHPWGTKQWFEPYWCNEVYNRPRIYLWRGLSRPMRISQFNT